MPSFVLDVQHREEVKERNHCLEALSDQISSSGFKMNLEKLDECHSQVTPSHRHEESVILFLVCGWVAYN